MHYKRLKRLGSPGDPETKKHLGDGKVKWCPDCCAYLPNAKFYWASSNAKRSRRSGYCIEHMNERSREANAARRASILDIMGRVCVRCGFDDERALQIDHVNGGGCAEYDLLGRNSVKLYQRMMENPDDYQILCANCNAIKKIECGEHPGRKEVPAC